MSIDNPVSPAPRQARSSWQDASKLLVEAWKTLRKRWAWVLTFTLGGLVIAAFHTAGQQRIYKSSCVIQIDPKPPKPLGQDVQAIVDVGANSYWANAEYYKTQFQIIQSRAVSEETVRRLGLHRDVGFLRGLGPKDARPAASAGAESTSNPAGSIEAAAARVRGGLSVEPIRDSRLVTISYADSDPERARQILATLVAVYVDRNVDVALDSTNSAADWLRGQVDKLKQELEGSENALHNYKTDNRILSVSLDDQSNMLRQEMQQLSAALTAVRVRRTQVAAQAEELAKLGSNLDLSNSLLLRDPTLQSLRDALVLAQADHDSLIGAGKGEMHPLVASARARIEVAREALKREVENIRQAAQRELSTVDHEVNSLATLLEQAHQRAQELGGLEIEYRRLERSKTQTEKLYSLVLERSKESDLTRMMRFNNIQTIDPPLVPKSPISPRVPLNMAIGLIGGVALGLFGAFAREMFDQSVKSPTDIEQEIGVTFLGLLPLLGRSSGPEYASGRRRSRRGRDAPERVEWIVHEDSTSAIAEAARSVRTNLSFMSPDQPYRTFLITSAAPSEGKTTVACWLATAMAQAGNKVLLVDCDLRRPRMHRVFDFANDRGVTTALVDRSTLKDAVRETDIPGLSVLLSGPPSPSPAENLQSKSFENLLAELAGTYDRVVIDSPPVSPVTDAVILSTRVDASVLVVRALSSSREVVRHACKSLQDVRANLAGAVLNAGDPRRQGYSYYHRYYGRSEGETESSA